LKAWVPITYQAFMDYRVGGAQFSAKGLDVVKRLISGEKVTQEQSGMSKREYTELMASLGQV
jgi:thymidylate synthase (FAD)